MSSLIQEKELTTTKLGVKILNFVVITTAQRNTMRFKEGSVIYNKDIKKLQLYDGGSWNTIL